MRNKKRHSIVKESKLCYIMVFLLCVLCVVPVILVVSASFSSEESVVKYGYAFLPRDFSLDTYKYLFGSKLKVMLSAFWMTIKTVVLGTSFSVCVTTLYAWGVTQKKEVFWFAKPLSFFAWFTTIFSGGVLPWYILCTQYYGLKNNIFALFIPYGISVWNMFILRGNFRSIPDELIEAAKIDGASNSYIFRKIALPLGRGGIATVMMFDMLKFWNDFYLPQWLISKSSMATAQKLLYNMLSNAAYLLNDASSSVILHVTPPGETAKMAVAVMTILPIMLVYPFTLRYFVKGINLGGVKG